MNTHLTLCNRVHILQKIHLWVKNKIISQENMNAYCQHMEMEYIIQLFK